ncbi:hypothetical protein ACTMU2_38115 [Cupriavidus basilensis]
MADTTWAVVSDPVPGRRRFPRQRPGPRIARNCRLRGRTARRAWPGRAYTERTPQAYREYWRVRAHGRHLGRGRRCALEQRRATWRYRRRASKQCTRWTCSGAAPNARLAVGARP